MVDQERYDLEIARIRSDVADAIGHLNQAAQDGVWNEAQVSSLKTAIAYFESNSVRLLRHVYFGAGK